MITGTIKNKIDKIWKDIWASGLTQPITVIIVNFISNFRLSA